MQSILRFIPADRGGRTAPPENAEGYSTVARFENDPQERLGVWSVRLNSVVPLRGREVIKADVRFLFETDAPAQLLQPGERFELLEGTKVVAKGVFLPDRLQVPTHVSEFEAALLG